MSETRNFLCQITKEVIGTLTLPDNTPEQIWTRELAKLQAAHVVSRPEVIAEYKRRRALRRHADLDDARDVLTDVLIRDLPHNSKRIEAALERLRDLIEDHTAINSPPDIPDTERPVVIITSPANGAVINRTTTVAGETTDNILVIRTDLLLDGNVVRSANRGGLFSFNADVSRVSNGPHTLTVNAYDPSGNVGTASISINVSNT